MLDEPRGRPPGRPRSAEADEAILAAAIELLVEKGFRALSMEGVRLRAGVGKATVYRRWRTKHELVVAAVERLTPGIYAPEDQGSLRADFAKLFEQTLRTMYAPRMAALMPRLMAEAVDDEELYEIFYSRLVEPRREIVRILLRRAAARGEIRRDLDFETLIDVLVGPHIYRIVISAGRPERLGRGPMDVFDAVYAGIAVR